MDLLAEYKLVLPAGAVMGYSTLSAIGRGS